MKENNIHRLVFSKNVIEFVTVASEFCLTMEKVSAHLPGESIAKL